MTHSAIHFAAGVAVATIYHAPALVRRWRAGEPLARPLLRWLLACYGVGLLANGPGLLRHLGLPASFCGGWWMNLFVLHPLLTRLQIGGTIIASACLVACFAFQYVILLAAVGRTRKTLERNKV